MKIPKTQKIDPNPPKSKYRRSLFKISRWTRLCDEHETNGRKWIDSLWFCEIKRQFYKSCVWIKWRPNIVSWKSG